MKRPVPQDFSNLIPITEARLSENKTVHLGLPVWGRIHMDRQLPFLCVYRKPAAGGESGAERFTRAFSSHMICSGRRSQHQDLSRLAEAISRNLVRQFGSCLLLELWESPPPQHQGPVTQAEMIPEFTLVSARITPVSVSDYFSEALARLTVGGNKAVITTRRSDHYCPRKYSPLITARTAREVGCHLLGIEISPVYRNPETGELYPYVLRRMARQFNLAANRALFHFTRNHTSHRPPHYHSLGRRAFVKSVWEADRMLAGISDTLDILLNVTPVNTESSFIEFKKSRFEIKPQLHYRPLPTDPVLLKNQLYRTPVTKIEEPVLAQLFREQLEYLDRQIDMLRDRNTPRFHYSSIQVYGGVDKELLDLAEMILGILPSRNKNRKEESLDARAFVKLAEAEIAKYRELYPDLSASARVRDDVAGALVLRGNLLVNGRMRFSPGRARALINHEVGTHVLTYANGRAQPLQQLYSGLAGYESLQEGLAVLGEYLDGELNVSRLRLLAARVVAVQRMIDGMSFVDNFHELNGKYNFTQRTAYGIILRTYRGGGLAKDAVYLRGLRDLFGYLQKGGELEPLYVGKVNLSHLPIINELRWRKVLKPPPLTPLFLKMAESQEKLAGIRNGLSLLDIVKKVKKGR